MKEPVSTKKIARSFTVFSLILLVFAVMIVVIVNYSHSEKITGWGITLAQIMLFYLFFVSFRVFLLLLFSSLEYAFDKVIEKPTFFPLVSIIVPCFNEEKVITEAIKSLLEIDYPNYEVIVVDDGSFDMTTIVAKQFEQKHRLKVVYQENGGKARALNRGIDEAVGDYILCVDADSVLNKDVLQLAMPFFEGDPDLAAVAGSVYVGNDKKGMLAKFQKLEYVVGLNFHKRAQSYLNIVTIVPGPIGVFKKDLVKKIGGYSPHTFAEDCDLSMRLLLEGYHVKYCPKMIALTEAPLDINSLMVQRYRWTRGMIQAIAINSKWFNPLKTNFRNFFILGYMLVETILIPSANYIFSTLTVSYALVYGVTEIFGPYFLGLTILDMSLSLYSILFEKHIISLFFLSMINRFTYGFMLEVVRFYSIFDELFKLPMKWGVIPRTGMKD